MMYSLREALNAFRRAPVLTGLSALMIALSLFAVGLFGLVAHNVRQVLDRVESRVEVVAFLRDDASAAALQTALEQIRSYEEVREVRHITREEALMKARAELDELSGIFGSLESNPLPASIEIALHPGQSGADAVRAVASRVEKYDIVEEVKLGDWLEAVYVLRRVAGIATVALGAGFAAVAALIIGAAIRMAVFARRDEIVIMRLVGATDAFVRRPFLIEGMLTGLAGGVLALLATWAVLRSVPASVFTLEWLPSVWVAGGVAAGALVGLLASSVAVRRHLRELA